MPLQRCGYNLRGLRSHACPECGLRLRLSVINADPMPGLFWTGVAGLSTGLGFFLLILFAASLAAFNGATLDWSAVGLSLLAVAGFGALLAILVKSRERLEKQSRAVRLFLAGLCCASPFVAMLVIGFMRMALP